jgi:hypothetical protein
MECAPIGIIGHKQCCRPLGSACTNPGQFEECCAVGEGGDPVTCAPNNTCGGEGAMRFDPSMCASGDCCSDGMFGECCWALHTRPESSRAGDAVATEPPARTVGSGRKWSAP